MKMLMNFLMLSCKKAASLIDKKVEAKLSWKENIQLTMHKSMCNACTAYEKQTKLIDKILYTHIHSDSETNIPVIKNKELQKQIITKL